MTSVAEHYRRPGLLAAIEAAIDAAGLSTATIRAEDLAPLDEFHVGGRRATADLLSRLAAASGQHLLDVGCGLGGPARFAAASQGCRVTGIDLTEDYVVAGNQLSRWLGQDRSVSLLRADALALPFDDGAFDGGYLIHAGMNIRDKGRLFSGVARVLRRGARFAVYDVMHTGTEAPDYPLPWATTPQQSALAAPDAYRTALAAAGLTCEAEIDQRELALAHFARQRALAGRGSDAPALGLQLLMGARRQAQVRHMSQAIERGLVSPVLMIACRR